MEIEKYSVCVCVCGGGRKRKREGHTFEELICASVANFMILMQWIVCVLLHTQKLLCVKFETQK
jgi:hypothetical protein